jgi:hypothetical protein
MNRLAVIAKLKPEAEKRAEELIAEGPPFDPSGMGFERHSVYLAGVTRSSFSRAATSIS